MGSLHHLLITFKKEPLEEFLQKFQVKLWIPFCFQLARDVTELVQTWKPESLLYFYSPSTNSRCAKARFLSLFLTWKPVLFSILSISSVLVSWYFDYSVGRAFFLHLSFLQVLFSLKGWNFDMRMSYLKSARSLFYVSLYPIFSRCFRVIRWLICYYPIADVLELIS